MGLRVTESLIIMKKYLLLFLALVATTSADPLAETPKKVEKPYDKLIKGDWVHQEAPLAEDGLPFWIYGDRKLKRGKKSPLLIVLHGRRNNAKLGQEFKVQSIASLWAKKANYKENPCFVVQPYYPPKGGWEKIPEQLDETIKHLASHLPIDLERVYLFGFSNGGQGTFQALARQPEWYAGAVTVAGPVSPKSVVGKIKAPVWCWVGGNDTDLNKNVRLPELAKKLQAEDDRVRLNVVPNAGHNVIPQSIGTEKVRNWLFEQRLEQK